jgi:hypothetical protein
VFDPDPPNGCVEVGPGDGDVVPGDGLVVPVDGVSLGETLGEGDSLGVALGVGMIAPTLAAETSTGLVNGSAPGASGGSYRTEACAPWRDSTKTTSPAMSASTVTIVVSRRPFDRDDRRASSLPLGGGPACGGGPDCGGPEGPGGPDASREPHWTQKPVPAAFSVPQTGHRTGGMLIRTAFARR